MVTARPNSSRPARRRMPRGAAGPRWPRRRRGARGAGKGWGGGATVTPHGAVDHELLLRWRLTVRARSPSVAGRNVTSAAPRRSAARFPTLRPRRRPQQAPWSRPPCPTTPRSTPPVSDVWLNIVMVVVFVLIGGFFSGTELALISLRESQVRGAGRAGPPRRRAGPAARRPQPVPRHGADRRHPGHPLGVRLRCRDAQQAVRRRSWSAGASVPGLAGTAGLHLRHRRGQLPVAGRSAS